MGQGSQMGLGASEPRRLGSPDSGRHRGGAQGAEQVGIDNPEAGVSDCGPLRVRAGDVDQGGVPRQTGIRTCVGEAKVKDICPGPAAGAGAAAASA